MPRYRMVLEIDTDEPRIVVNQLAKNLCDKIVGYATPVYLSTEKVEPTIEVLKTF